METIINSTVFQYLIGLFALGFVVFVHELGHFVVARLCGIRILRFSIGFGPRILSFKRGETEYTVCWLFFGGYVKFAGDDIDEENARTIEGGYFSSEPWKRNLTAAAGPLMNLFFAFLLYCGIALLGKPILVDRTPTTIGEVTLNSPAVKAGIHPGDKILKIDDVSVHVWRDVINAIILSGKDEIVLQVLREGEMQKIFVEPVMDTQRGIRRIGVMKMEEVIIDQVYSGSSAEKAGLMHGDRIVSFADQKIYSMFNLHEVIQKMAIEKTVIEVERDGKRYVFPIQAELSDELDIYDIGITQKYDIQIIYPNPISAIKQDIVNVFKTLNALITRTVSVKGLAGPVGILKIIGVSTKFGFVFFLGILAMISVNLGILNLLPIPVLDGGHLLINTIEGAIKKPINRKVLASIQYLFLVALLSLIIFVTYNDIKRMSDGMFSKSDKQVQQETK